MHTIEDLVGSLQLEPIGDNRYRAGNLPVAHGVVFGGQLMGQSIVAALLGQEGKTVKTLHTVFARAGSTEAPVEIVVEPVHSGRTLSSTTVTIQQGDRICTKSSVLLSADDDDLIRHADPAPTVAGPDASVAAPDVHGDWEIRVVDGVDISDPDAVGPPVLDVWTRFVGAPDEPAVDQALVAFATDGFLIGAAMRPHAGVGQSQAHVTLSTGVGGSLVSIGTAAGVALMGLVRNHYTFLNHLRWAWAIALGYVASILTHLWINAALM